MILKSFIIEKDIGLLDQHNHILMYGENDGIKGDIKDKIIKKNKDCEIITLFQEELIKNNFDKKLQESISMGCMPWVGAVASKSTL